MFREVIDEYGKEVVKLCGRLMKLLSINLGLAEDVLQNAFGGDNIGACLRVNFYPKCPRPDLTLGLSSHSDPGGMTLLLPDAQVPGLQVRKDNKWITVKPARHAFIVNIGDQIQVFLLFLFLLVLNLYLRLPTCSDRIQETYYATSY
jgi:isopenicillin N synthase-like dioxygenase